MPEDCLKSLTTSLMDGNPKDVVKYALESVEQYGVEKTLASMYEGMDEVGRLFESGEYFIPQVLYSANNMKCGINAIKPYFKAAASFN